MLEASERRVIHLAVAFDQNFIVPFYAFSTSVFRNNPSSRIVFHSIVTGVSLEGKNQIAEYIRFNQGEIHFYEIDEDYVQSFYVSPLVRFTPAVYYRLLFPSLLPAYLKKIIYLDVDIIVNNSLAELYDLDIHDKPLAAVSDSAIPVRPSLGILERGAYFNSGVLLMNLPEWRKQKVSEKAIEFLINYPEKIGMVDQDALNAVLINNWHKLSNRFNIMNNDIPGTISNKELRAFIKDKVVIHFTFNKPWSGLCANRLRYLYHDHLKASGIKAPKYLDFSTSFKYLSEFAKIRVIELGKTSPFIVGTVNLLRRYRILPQKKIKKQFRQPST